MQKTTLKKSVEYFIDIIAFNIFVLMITSIFDLDPFLFGLCLFVLWCLLFLFYKTIKNPIE